MFFRAAIFAMGTITFWTIAVGTIAAWAITMMFVFAWLVAFGAETIVTLCAIARRAAPTAEVTLGMRQVCFAAIARLCVFDMLHAILAFDDFAFALHAHRFSVLTMWAFGMLRPFAVMTATTITMTVTMSTTILTTTIMTGAFIATTAAAMAPAVAFATIIIARTARRSRAGESMVGHSQCGFGKPLDVTQVAAFRAITE